MGKWLFRPLIMISEFCDHVVRRRVANERVARKVAIVMKIRLALAAVLIVGLIVALFIDHSRRQEAAAAAVAEQERLEAAEDSPVLTADPPATETSSQTVLEDEPIGPPIPPQASVPSGTPEGVSEHGRPAWERFALPAPPSGGRPVIAVIIDDMGLDRRRSEKVLQLSGPLTVSFMSYAEDLTRQSEEAKAHDHEVMMHVPMEPLSESQDPGQGALLVSLSPEELRKRIADDLDRFKGYVGINNHMGSKFTGNAPGMQVVMEELHRRGLLFIDSLTTEHSVGLASASQAGVPTAARNVFLDNAGDLASVNAQLGKLEEVARKKGNAIAIGHPRDATIAALEAWLPTLRDKGFVLVPVTAVVKARQPGSLASH